MNDKSDNIIKNVYFVRHGETLDNKARVYPIDDETSVLSELGHQQASILAKRLSNLKIDHIFASPLKRAVETAEIINGQLNKKLETNELFREINESVSLKGLTYDDPKIKESIDFMKGEMLKNEDFKDGGMESFNEIRARLSAACDILASAEGNILVVSHARFIKAFTARLLFKDDFNPVRYYDFIKFTLLKNTSVTIFKYHDRNDQKHKWQLKTWDDLAHLD